MRRYLRDGLWVVCVLVLIGMMGRLFKPEPAPLHARLAKGTVLAVDGICLGDSRARVESVLGAPAKKITAPACTYLFYGFHDAGRYPTVILLHPERGAEFIKGNQLTDAQGSAICCEGVGLSELKQLLGDPDSVRRIIIMDADDSLHFKDWKLGVKVRNGCATQFSLEEPPRGEVQ